ncbi:MAG: hypothetical protein WCS88_03850 [Patescibacteria group bacterium]|jgi:hypothetical protein
MTTAIYRTLPVPLTAEEIKQHSEELVAELGNVDRLTDEKKSIASSIGERVKEAQAKVTRLAYEIRTKSARRPVECEWRFEYGRGVASLHRADTGEIVETRPMTEGEMNGTLPLEDEDDNVATIGAVR